MKRDGSEPSLLTEASAVAAACARFAEAEFVTVDTEFVRERTYLPRPCLVQIASPAEHALIDLLALEDLDPLRALLLGSPVLKVFHAARQDLALFLELMEDVPRPIVDTQVAAALLGLGEQVGLAGLVRELSGVELPKEATRTDWSRRPLSAEQLAYATADVTCLVPAWIELRQRLEARSRLPWAMEEGTALTDLRLHRTDPAAAWRSVRGARRLSGRGLAVLRELAAWRERRARAVDRPRRWVLADDVLLALARRDPANVEDLRDVRELGARERARLGTAILAAVRGAADDVPAGMQRRRTTPAEAALADSLVELVRERAAAAEVEPTVVASRSTLERLARGEEPSATLLSGWRRELLGDELDRRLVAVRTT